MVVREERKGELDCPERKWSACQVLGAELGGRRAGETAGEEILDER